ncbi:hypothetical protein [Streptomyces griseus]|uniref:hypothetical protein n=1 Tax=Streptomyces griseus TaxID=1911 RepID=UPI000A7B9B57|nr:hypothetical protein [Streptomyces griseus]
MPLILGQGLTRPDPPRVKRASPGKAGVRTLVTLLGDQYEASGVHVATTCT